MNKKLIWGIVIVVVVIIGAFAYNYSKPFIANCCHGEQYIGSDWLTYSNPDNGLSFKYPSNWIKYDSEGPHVLLGAPDNSSAQLHVNWDGSQTDSLEAYIANIDRISAHAWEGQASKEVVSNGKLETRNGYEMIQREETFLAAGFTTFVTYIKKGDVIYTLFLTPHSDTGLSSIDKQINSGIIASIIFKK
jgi:hypothetical protein